MLLRARGTCQRKSLRKFIDYPHLGGNTYPVEEPPAGLEAATVKQHAGIQGEPVQ